MRIFIDSNIIISAIIFPHGKVAFVFDYILETHSPVISSFIQNECKTVFKRKFPDKYNNLEQFLSEIEFDHFESITIKNTDSYPKIRDTNDLPVLADAIASDSDILLTGDKDFEDIKIDKPVIISPSTYFNLIHNPDNS